MANTSTTLTATNSLNLTPQAVDDSYTYSEDSSTTALMLNVMADDLGGASKTLWSLDDGVNTTDLLTKDTTTDHSEHGALITIVNGQVSYALTDTLKAQVDGLSVGDTFVDHFTYAIRMANGTLSWATVAVTFTGTNDKPVLTIDTSGGVTEDASSPTLTDTGALSFTDVDIHDTHEVTAAYNNDAAWTGGSLTAAQVAVVTSGFSVDTDSWDYSVANSAMQFLGAGETITLSFDVTVADNHGGSDTKTVNLTITGTNDDPVLSADTAGAVSEDASDPTLTDTGALSFTDVDVNDTHSVSAAYNDDAAWTGGALTAAQAAAISSGFSADGDSWDYSVTNSAVQFLDAGETVTLSFDVTVSDNHGGADTETVTITITGQDDQPTLAAVATGSIAEDDQASTTTDNGLSGALAGADADQNDTLTYGIDGGAVSDHTATLAGDYGTLTVDTVTGEYLYTPNADAIEALDDGDTDSDVFTVTVTDGDGAPVTQTFTVNVSGADDAPTLATVVDGSVAEVDQSSSTTTDSLSGTLAGNDVDADDTLAYGIDGGAVSDHTATLAGDYGTLTVDTATGAYLYTPNADAIEALDDGDTDADVFTVTVSDGDGAPVTQTFTVNVSGADDAPTLGAVTDGSIAEVDQSSSTTPDGLSGTLAGNDVDADDTLAYGIDGGSVSDHTATLAGDYGTLTVDTVTGEYLYTPNADAIEALDDGDTDSDVFTVTVTDGDGAPVTQTFTVNVSGADDAPTLGAVTDGSIAEVDQSSSTTSDGLSGTLAGNDVDADDTLAYGIDGGAVSDHTATLAGDYGTLTVDTVTGEYLYTPNADAIEALDDGDTDSDAFTVTVSDGDGVPVTQTFTVNVSGADDAPTLGAVADGAVAEDALASTTTTDGLSGTLAGDDVDAGDTLSYGIDGGAVSDHTATLAGDYGTLTVDTVTGAYLYTPSADAIEALDAGDTDSDVFTVTVTDGDGALVTRTFTVDVSGANDAPVVDDAGSDLSGEGDEDNAITGAVHASDVDADDSFSFSVVNDGAGAPAHGTVGIDANTGEYTYTPDQDFNGSDSFTVTVTDSHGAADTVVVAVTVDPVNDAPVVDEDNSDLGVSGDEDTQIAGSIAAADVDSATLTYSAPAEGQPGGPAHGAVSFDASGGYIYTPDADYNGADSFTVTVSDGEATDTVNVSVTVNPVNDAPTLTDPTDIAYTDTAAADDFAGVTASLSAGDIDGGDTLTYGLTGGAGDLSLSGYDVSAASAYGTMYLNTATGAYHFEPDDTAINGAPEGSNPTASFTFTVSDGAGGSASQTLDVDITGANEAPTSPVSPAVYDGADDPNDFDTTPVTAVLYSGVSISDLNDNNILKGTTGVDAIDGKGGADTIYALAGNDTVTGGNGLDKVYGGEGNDTVTGDQDVDTLYGGSGNDTINGNQGADTIIGGYGADNLTGGADTGDTFVYLSTLDTGDTITDFVHGSDKLDLTAIDADTGLPSDQAFAFVAADTNAVQANSVTFHYDAVANVTHVWADVTGDTTADLQIDLTGHVSLSSGDFLL